MAQLQERSQNQSTELAALQNHLEREEGLIKQTQGLSEASKTQLKAYEAYRDKLVTSIRKRFDRISADATPVPQHSQHVNYLEKMNKDLSQAHNEAAKQNVALQRDLAVVEKQLQARSFALFACASAIFIYLHAVRGSGTWRR